MKVDHPYTIGLFDIDHQFRLQAQSAMRFFQEISTHHSTVAGAGPEVLFQRGVVWFLHRLEVEFYRYPLVYEKIQMTTWSRGFKRFKGFREYLMSSDQGVIARGTSVWIFYDVNKNRISKIPADIMAGYGIDAQRGLDTEIDDWKPCGKISPDAQVEITLRHSDFDINGHVNNTVYFGFLETLYYQTLTTAAAPIKNIKIRYHQEIDKGINAVYAGWKQQEDFYQFNIFDSTSLYADGEITPMIAADRC